MKRQIIGSSGGGGGGSSFVTRPDNLRSDDSFEILLGMGSGRWKGFTNGLQSVEINNVPLENQDGTENFQDVFVIFADGNPLENQIVNFELGGGGNSQTINTQLANSNANAPGGWVSTAVSTPNADFIDLRFVVQQLFRQDEDSLGDATATIDIEMRPSGTNDWINIFTTPESDTVVYDPEGYNYFQGDESGGFLSQVYIPRAAFNQNGVGFRASSTNYLTITGKTSSAFVKELRVQVPKTGQYADRTWEIRARLREQDTVEDDPITISRNILFETATAIINEPLGDDPEWDGLVWAKIHGKASDQFSGFPNITAICDTKICKVPSPDIFDPETRQYSSQVWDGGYVEAFTTDPAWQIKEFVEDPIHGIAGIYPGSTLDKWDALEASKYYSELVPDGRGGMHPRFNLNLTISESRSIDEMMQYLAGAVNSYTEETGNSTWRLKVDKPEAPVMLFTEDNVFGEFAYSHSDVDTRFNDWRGTFLDEDLDYETNTVRVFDQEDIDRNGTRFTEIALVGCTNSQEALRRLMFRLRVSINEFKSVTFRTNRAGRLLQPLDTILVADGALNPNYLIKSTSRIDSISGNIIYLKRPLRLETGVEYNINIGTTESEVVSRRVLNSDGNRGDVIELTIDSPLPDEVFTDAPVALAAEGLASLPVAYRVISIEREEDNEDAYTISAIEIDTGKWDAMDNVTQQQLIAQESRIFIDAPTAPVGGVFNLVEYDSSIEQKRVLQVNWDRPGGSFLEGYRVEHRLNSGPWVLDNSNLSDSTFEIQSPEDGHYSFRITAIDRRGVTSSPLEADFTVAPRILPPIDLSDDRVNGPLPVDKALPEMLNENTDTGINLIAVGTGVVSNNAVTKTGGFGFNGGAYSAEAGDSFYVSFKYDFSTFVNRSYVCLSKEAQPDGTSLNNTVAYVQVDGIGDFLRLYVDGLGFLNLLTSDGTIPPSGLCTILYQGSVCRFFVNGVELGSRVSQDENAVVRALILPQNSGQMSKLQSISYGQANNSTWEQIRNSGSTGVPADNASANVSLVKFGPYSDRLTLLANRIGSTGATNNSGVHTLTAHNGSCLMEATVNGNLHFIMSIYDTDEYDFPADRGTPTKYHASVNGFDQQDGTFQVQLRQEVNGTFVFRGTFTGFQFGDTVAIRYNGVSYALLRNGTVVSSHAAVPGLNVRGAIIPQGNNNGAFFADNVDWTAYGDDSTQSIGGLGLTEVDIRNPTLTPEGFLVGNINGNPVNYGNVTISGIGYVGDLDATRNIGALADLDILPESRADEGLKNSNLLPSIQDAATRARYDRVSNAPTNLGELDGAANTKLSGIQAEADVTAQAQVVITPPPAQIIYRNFDGSVKNGQFINPLTVMVQKGSTDIRTDASVSYAITTSGGVTNAQVFNSGANKGRIAVNEAIASGAISLTVTISGVAYGPFSTPFSTQDDPPPTQSGGNSGGGSGTSGVKQRSDSSFATINVSNTFQQITSTGSGETIFIIQVDDGETLKGTAPLEYFSNGSSEVIAKWQYQAPNGAWQDFGPQILGTQAGFDQSNFEQEPGFISVNQQVSNLNNTGAPIDFLVRLVARAQGSAASDIISGTANVVSE